MQATWLLSTKAWIDLIERFYCCKKVFQWLTKKPIFKIKMFNNLALMLNINDFMFFDVKVSHYWMALSYSLYLITDINLIREDKTRSWCYTWTLFWRTEGFLLFQTEHSVWTNRTNRWIFSEWKNLEHLVAYRFPNQCFWFSKSNRQGGYYGDD